MGYIIIETQWVHPAAAAGEQLLILFSRKAALEIEIAIFQPQRHILRVLIAVPDIVKQLFPPVFFCNCGQSVKEGGFVPKIVDKLHIPALFFQHQKAGDDLGAVFHP